MVGRVAAGRLAAGQLGAEHLADVVVEGGAHVDGIGRPRQARIDRWDRDAGFGPAHAGLGAGDRGEALRLVDQALGLLAPVGALHPERRVGRDEQRRRLEQVDPLDLLVGLLRVGVEERGARLAEAVDVAELAHRRHPQGG